MSKIRTTNSIAYGIAIRSDYIGMIAFSDYGDPWDYNVSMAAFYEPVKEWGYEVINWYSTGMCISYNAIPKSDGINARAYVILGREGEIEIDPPSLDNIKIIEHIPDAGLYQKWSKNYGYLSCVKEIGDHLYVCGDGNQVYRRNHNGTWVHMDQGILQEPTESNRSEWTSLTDIAGLTEDSIYVVGIEANIYHYNGHLWRKIPHDIDNEALARVKIISEDEVYIVGHHGVLLKGNHREGFRDISSPTDIQNFTDVQLFNGTLFLASNKGMYYYDTQTHTILPYQTDLEVDLISTHILDAKDGVLWSIGIKDVAYFDGQRWTRIDIPNNPKIGGGNDAG